MANTILAKMAVTIAANTAEFNKGLNTANSSLKSFTSNVNNTAIAVATAFSAKEIGNFILEANKLAGTFEGVERAFNRLPNSEILMDNLREATHGTVGELELMQQALRAKNFGISVKDLSTYLEFAAIRAQQTGESVDYMVNSIILGLGRGSIKILDNLQVNIAKIKETVEQTGVSLQEAFRQQVQEQMQTIGGYAETSATKVAELEKAFKSLRLEFSRKLESGDLLKNFTAGVQQITQFIRAGGDYTKLRIIEALDRVEKSAIERAKSVTDSLKGSIQEQQDIVQQEMNTLVELINKRNNELRRVNQEIKNIGQGLDSREQRENLIAQGNAMRENIAVMNRTIDLLKEYNTTIKTGANDQIQQLGIIEKLRQDIENEESFLNAAKTEADVATSVAALKKLNEELDRLLGKQKEVKSKLVLQFSPDIEAEGSTNPELRNEQAANAAKQFAIDIAAIGTSAEFTGGALVQLGESISENVVNPIQEAGIEIGGLVAGGLTDLISSLAEASVSGGNFGQAILRSLGAFAQQFGALLIATGIGKITFDSFKSGPAMIAAGAALVALGGAVRSTIANRPNLGSGSGGVAINRGNGFGPQNTVISGDFRIDGRDLVFVYDKNKSLDGRRK